MSHSTANGYDSEYPSIHDVTSRQMDTFVLAYGPAAGSETTLLGFDVTRSQRRTQYAQSEPTVPANGTVGFGYFGENGHSADVADPGEDILRIEDQRPETIVEYGVAVDATENVLVGVESPPDSVVSGINPESDRGRRLDATRLDQYGGVPATTTFIDAPSSNEPIPTTALSPGPEQGLIRIDSRESGRNTMRFAFKNTAGQDADLTVTFVGRTYRVSPIQDPQVTRDLVKSDDARVINYGGLDNDNPNLPRDWNKYEATVSGSALVR